MKQQINKIQELNALLNGPAYWVVMPDFHEQTKAKVQSFLSGYSVDDDEEPAGEAQPDMEAPPSDIGSSVEVINVSGELVKAGGLDEDLCCQFGICDIDNAAAQLREAAQDENVIFICLVFDTPGGESVGIKELAQLISTIAESKMVIGYCSTVAASGGYWLASQCSMFFCSDSSTIGNVGCFRERLDLTKQLEQSGVKVNIIKDGEAKVDGHPATVMSKEEEARIQERVSTIANEFRQAILSKRTVDTQYLQGQTFLGEKAADPNINLADDNCNSLEDLLTVFVQLTYL